MNATTQTSNANHRRELIGEHVQLSDGRTGRVTAASYGLLSIELDDVKGGWISGPLHYFANAIVSRTGEAIGHE